MAARLHKIVDVEIDARRVEDTWTEKRLAAILTPIANACAELKSLRLLGDTGHTILGVFSVACKSLTHLDTDGMPPRTLCHLNRLVPNLISVSATISIPHKDLGTAARTAFLADFCKGVAECKVLTSLHVMGGYITKDMWAALPPSIQEIQGHLWRDGDHDGQPKVLPCLQRVVIREGSNTDLTSLISLMEAGPGVKHIAISAVYARFKPTCQTLFHMQILHKKMLGGVVFAGEIKDKFEHGVGPDNHRRWWQDQRSIEQKGMVMHLEYETLPSCEHSLLRASDMKFDAFKNISTHHGLWFLTTMGHMFAGMETVQLGGDVTDCVLARLSSFEKLQAMYIYNNEKVTVVGLGHLCVAIPALKWLRICVCTNISTSHHVSIIANHLQAAGRNVNVEIVPFDENDKALVDGDQVATEEEWS